MKPIWTVPHSKVVCVANYPLKASAEAADAKHSRIRTAFVSLMKLTLTKLELKVLQFEEPEDILEEERGVRRSSDEIGIYNDLDDLQPPLVSGVQERLST